MWPERESTSWSTAWQSHALPSSLADTNDLGNFGRVPPAKRFRMRKKSFEEIVDYPRHTTTDVEQPPNTISHHEHFVLRWAKTGIVNVLSYGRRHAKMYLRTFPEISALGCPKSACTRDAQSELCQISSGVSSMFTDAWRTAWSWSACALCA